MSSRCWGLAIVSIFTLALAPSAGRSQTYDKEPVAALSKKIDAHLARVWKKAGVTPSPMAENHVFFRRLNLDLAGRIPELIPMGDFVDDNDPDKRWTWVDRLLDSPDHAKHFADVWRSIMLGNQTNQQVQFQVPQFEQWLRERIEKDVALDKMVQQLLTNQPNNGNMAFNGINGQQVPASTQAFFQAAENKAENLAGATSRVFLGIKIECAQCHAHPFAKWSKDQFWEFAAFYSNAPQVRRPPGGAPSPPMPTFQWGREILIPGTDKVVRAKFLNGEEPKWDASTPRKTLTDWMTSPKNPYFARAMADHIWSYLMGVSLLEPIMEPSDDSPITHPDLLNDLATALIEHDFNAKFLIRAIVHTDAYQRSSGGAKLADKEDYHLFVRMPIRALSPEQIWDNFDIATRDPNDPRMTVVMNPNQFFNPGQFQSPRAQFLSKFTNQDRRHEPTTSILQALFMMNGKAMTERTSVESNYYLRALVRQETYYDRHVKSLYMITLSRPPRPHELERMTRYLDRSAVNGELGEALSNVYWALLNSSEFLHNH